MTKLSLCLLALLFSASFLAYGQDYPNGGWYSFRPNQEIRVHSLPMLRARSHDLSDVLLTSLDTVFHDRTICCGEDSALGDTAQSADPLSLKNIASKLQGRHRQSDGRSVRVTAELWTPSQGDISYQIVSALINQHAMLLVWGSHLYVLDGAVFDQTAYSDGTSMNVIHKLLLVDTRFSDSRREVVFNRDTDDLGKVQGMLLLLAAAPQ
jgi:hypothetical protein